MLAAIMSNLSGSPVAARNKPSPNPASTTRRKILMKICSSILFTALPRFLFTSFPGATSKAARKATLLLFSIAVVLAGGATTVHGQSALDGFDPNANGVVHAVVV